MYVPAQADVSLYCQQYIPMFILVVTSVGTPIILNLVIVEIAGYTSWVSTALVFNSLPQVQNAILSINLHFQQLRVRLQPPPLANWKLHQS